MSGGSRSTSWHLANGARGSGAPIYKLQSDHEATRTVATLMRELGDLLRQITRSRLRPFGFRRSHDSGRDLPAAVVRSRPNLSIEPSVQYIPSIHQSLLRSRCRPLGGLGFLPFIILGFRCAPGFTLSPAPQAKARPMLAELDQRFL